MLIRVKVENFLSFKNEIEFNMSAGNSQQSQNRVKEISSDLKLLQSSVIYGANASGKTNLVKALEFLQDFITEDELKKGQKISQIKSFKLDDSFRDECSKFEIDFFINKRILSYSLHLTETEIHKERLVEIKGTKEHEIFKRGKSVSFSSKYFKKKMSKARLEFMAEDLLPNQPFLSILNKRKVETIENSGILIDAYRWFNTNLVIIFPDSKYQGLEFKIGNDDNFKQTFTNYLKSFDTDINNVKLDKIDIDKAGLPAELKDKIISTLDAEEQKDKSRLVISVESKKLTERYLFIKETNGNIIVKKLQTEHLNTQGKKVSFELKDESDGTRRLMDLIPAMINADNTVFVIDEINRSLHPHLTKNLFSKFFNNISSLNSQLISTTHETTIMDNELFRRDEIWLMEKNQETKESKLFSLEEFNVRKDLKYSKSYLHGRFGALPCLKDI